MADYNLRGINVPPEEFLRPFFDLKERVCLRVFSDKPGSAFSGQKLECQLEHFADVADDDFVIDVFTDCHRQRTFVLGKVARH